MSDDMSGIFECINDIHTCFSFIGSNMNFISNFSLIGEVKAKFESPQLQLQPDSGYCLTEPT